VDTGQNHAILDALIAREAMTNRVTAVAALLGALLQATVATALRAQAADGASRFALLDSTRIHYQSYGQGTAALVLIHGWTCNLDNWRDQIPDLAKRSRVIAIDLPGHGQSDKPQLTYSMDLFARGVTAVLRDAGVQRAVLVGHSMGTPVARQFYRKYPERTLGLVAVDGPLQPFFDQQRMDGLLASLRSADYQNVGAGMLASMASPATTAEMKQRIRASFLNTPQHVVVSAMEGLADSTIWGPDQIKVPVLVIAAGSRSYPPDIEQRSRAIAPQLEFQMWEGVGHFLMMEQPKRFNDAVIAFLDKNGLLKR
jgi:pimeloyl-ACP methyl ester carboxylesterase